MPDFIKEFDLDAVDLDVDRQSSIVLKGVLDFKTGQRHNSIKRRYKTTTYSQNQYTRKIES